MKKIHLIVSGLALLASSLQAQVKVTIGTPPPWGPAGYAKAHYYYLPDIETYYDVRSKQFISYNSGSWNRTRALPIINRNYDLYSGYKVVLNNYHGSTPYSHFKSHKVSYSKGYKNGLQKTNGIQKHGKQGNQKGTAGKRKHK